MLKFDIHTSGAIEKCVRLNIPFALYAMPDEGRMQFLASDPRRKKGGCELTPEIFDSFDGFVFNYFEVDKTLHAFGISRDLTAEDILSGDFGSGVDPDKVMSVPATYLSTDKMIYYAQANNIISQMKNDREKTVLAHVVSIESDCKPWVVALKFFNRFPGCFRHLYFTPESGMWFGASPEMLIDYDRTRGDITSMSLAGTRRVAGDDAPWDNKNVLEHNIVTAFITNVLEAVCNEVDSPSEAKVTFGNIEHLCHIIKGEGCSASPSEILPLLSPTPALCGWPRDKAFSLILGNEAFERRCYGGFVGLTDPGHTTLFANLRCAYVKKSVDNENFIYNLFGGGGLTRHSDAESEWKEAKSKIRVLQNLISNSNSHRNNCPRK